MDSAQSRQTLGVRAWRALALLAGLAWAGPAVGADAGFAHLQVRGRTVIVRDANQLSVTYAIGLRRTGPHNFIKVEDSRYHFEVSLVSLVARDTVVSIAAERLVEAEALNYDELPAATWPDAGFRLRASACTTLTPAQAAAMPAESGMAWIRAAGFVPDGSFVYEASLLLAPDRRHEATIELIAPVKSCDDPAAVKAALATLRAHLKVTRAR